MTLRFSREHQWIDTAAPGAAPVGITPHAQDTLGDIVFVELPAVGTAFKAGGVVAVVESVKAASDVFMPMGGTVVEVNEALRADPGLANTDPLGAGWFFKVALADAAEAAALMDEAAYSAFAAAA